MSRQIQIRRGTADENNGFTGAIGEITMDTTNNTLRVHDGETLGGTTLAKKSDLPDLNSIDYVVESQLPTPENNYTWYRKYKSGWIEQGGIIQIGTSDANITVTLPITMLNAFYNISCAIIFNGTNNVVYRNISCWNLTPSSFIIRQDTQIIKHWQISGQSTTNL